MARIMRSQVKRAIEQEQGSLDPQEIARVAFELYEQRGGADGFDQQDWYEAEQIVRRRSAGRRRA